MLREQLGGDESLREENAKTRITEAMGEIHKLGLEITEPNELNPTRLGQLSVYSDAAVDASHGLSREGKDKYTNLMHKLSDLKGGCDTLLDKRYVTDGNFSIEERDKAFLAVALEDIHQKLVEADGLFIQLTSQS